MLLPQIETFYRGKKNKRTPIIQNKQECRVSSNVTCSILIAALPQRNDLPH